MNNFKNRSTFCEVIGNNMGYTHSLYCTTVSDITFVINIFEIVSLVSSSFVKSHCLLGYFMEFQNIRNRCICIDSTLSKED